MTVNKLMVNDWVLDTFHKPMRVRDIIIFDNKYSAKRYVNGNSLEGGGAYCQREENIKPILLTAEILEKNGFVPNTHIYPYPYYEYINEKDKLKIGFAFPKGNKTSYKEPWVYIDSENVFIEHLPCIFVHQLQQIFRLCRMNGMADNIEI